MTVRENRRTFLRLLPAGGVLLTLPWLPGCAERGEPSPEPGPGIMPASPDQTACVQRAEPGPKPVPGITPASSAQIPDGKAELYLLNDLVAKLGAYSYSAKIVEGDGNRAIVDLKPRDYARFFISPGPHTLKLMVWGALTKWSVEASITINAKAGARYDVVAKIYPNRQGPYSFRLDQVSEEKARSLMEKMTAQ